MRGTQAKRLRRYVRKRYPFLSVDPLYREDHTGKTLRLAAQCQRGIYQSLKTSWKRRLQNV